MITRGDRKWRRSKKRLTLGFWHGPDHEHGGKPLYGVYLLGPQDEPNFGEIDFAQTSTAVETLDEAIDEFSRFVKVLKAERARRKAKKK